jgi:dihydroorotase
MAYDLVLKGATVIDPSQDLHAQRDVALEDGRIAAIETEIEAPAQHSLDLRGKILTPGWIDIHAHVYAGSTTWGIQPDAFCLATGVTTIVDAGSAGWANFIGFRDYIAAPSRTQVLSFLHISGIGLTYGPLGEMTDLAYADPERTAFVAHEFADICVGIKVRQGSDQVGDNGVEPLRLGLRAAEMADIPVMVHIGRGVPLPEVLDLMRPGDILTHCYQGVGDTVIGTTAEGDGVIPQVWEARQRGVLFDLGHGGGSFHYGVAKKALADGFGSDVISTDIHAHSIRSPVHSLPETASKLLNLGVQLPDVVRQTTTAAAAAIGRQDQLGTLRLGTVADLAAFELSQGDFEFFDSSGRREIGPHRLDPVLTVRAGTPYRPDELAEEVEETLRRAHQIKSITGRRFAQLGWVPGS